MKKLLAFGLILTLYSSIISGQNVSRFISKKNVTDFEKDIIMKSSYVSKINKETKIDWRFQTFNEKCKKYGMTSMAYKSGNNSECFITDNAIEAYAICFGKWYLLSIFSQEANIGDGDPAYTSTQLEVRTKEGELVDRLLIWKTERVVWDTVGVNYCTTAECEVKILKMWKNRTSYKRIENMSKKERSKEELYPTLPRTCFKILTYKIDSVTGKFVLQQEVETGTLLKEYESIGFDKDSPLYKYR